MKVNDAAEILKGVIENVVFYNADNDYTVIEIVGEDHSLITAVGTMTIPFEGENVTLTGKWSYHKEFGKQFCFDSYEKHLPKEIEGILQYLSSHTVKGVGPVTAQKIVDRFGENTFEVMESHPEWLTDIPGITMKKAAQISESFREQNVLRGVVMFCKDYMGVSEATRVYKRLGAGAIGIITENPYILCRNEYGIGFVKTDELAMSIGFDKESDYRVLSCLEYIVNNNGATNGHTCLPIDTLLSLASEILQLEVGLISQKLESYLDDAMISSYRINGVRYVTTNKIAEAEDYIAKRLVKLNRTALTIDNTNIEALVEKNELDCGIKFAHMQKKAIYEALNNGVTVITGGPGTGKTTIVKALLSIFKGLGLKTVLCAPTGRAAKRMGEATSEEAKTIHRMLEMDWRSDLTVNFGRNVVNPLDEYVVIVDEASMIDIHLMDALLKAMKRGSRLILIGDFDQLPSVGAGNVLKDIISSGCIETVSLSEIFRQSKESLIVVNAHKINDGELPVLNSVDKDFFFVRREREQDIAETIADLVVNRLPRKYGNDIRGQIQVITPSKKGAGGIETLNSVLQSRLNPQSTTKAEKIAHGTIFREGDKVMQTTNNYEIEWERGNLSGVGIFNGDIGTVVAVNNREKEMVIKFDDNRVARYGFDNLDELEIAYAITVHKSQGSEYPVVIIPSYYCPPMLMTRNLLYTAVTRAKRMVIIVGRYDIIGKMVENDKEVVRYTTLCHRLEDYK